MVWIILRLLVARLNSIQILFSVAINMEWPLFQLDVNNVFLYEDLKEKVYMKQPPGYVAQGENITCRLRMAIYRLRQSLRAWFEKFKLVISIIDFARCHSDHSVFVRRTRSGSVILAVYANDILLIGSNSVSPAETKEYLKHHFVTKDMKKPKYFLGIEVAYKKHGLLLSQRKYALDLLKETGFLGCKSASTTMKANVNFLCDSSHPLNDPGQYKRWIEKLIYLQLLGLI